MKKFILICTLMIIAVCIISLVRVGINVFPIIIITLQIVVIVILHLDTTKHLGNYIPIDNSQAQCIDDNCNNHYLAGTSDNPKRISLKVLVQPFDMEYTFMDKKYIDKFIIGLDKKTGLRHLVMYFDK